VELNPRDGLASDALGCVLFESQHYAEALEWFQHAQERMPMSPLPAYNAARALAALGRPAEARRVLEAILARSPDAKLARELLTQLANRPAADTSPLIVRPRPQS
jgi:predicted Zn-dependent protease